MAQSQGAIGTTKPAPKVAHVNLMIDTIIANVEADDLRAVLRGLLAADPSLTAKVQEQVLRQLHKSEPKSTPQLFTFTDNILKPTPEFEKYRRRARCLMGCGRGFESLQILAQIVSQASCVPVNNSDAPDAEIVLENLETVDGDIIQALTAVEKELGSTGVACQCTEEEQRILVGLKDHLLACQKEAEKAGIYPPFQRASMSLGLHEEFSLAQTPAILPASSLPSQIETVRLGPLTVPRIFNGLWQSSSPAWGSSSMTSMKNDFSKYVSLGLTAFDMADHYGDAELLFVCSRLRDDLSKVLAKCFQERFRTADPNSAAIICADKWCVFEPISISEDSVRRAVDQRLQRIQSQNLDLLQVHWQNYSVKDYIAALQFLESDPRISALGLVNFDTKRIEEIAESGLKIVSHQVQFSLIDSRPEFGMIAACEKHNIKLLTYGTLCGGFLAEKWLGQSEPESFDQGLTPSHRKYLEMISIWGGWELFQELLEVLSQIAKKHNKTTSLVATRWVLDHECVGAVIIGTRLGVSEHIEENLKVFGWRLDMDDLEAIGRIQERSQRKEIFNVLGDCGAEYRQ